MHKMNLIWYICTDRCPQQKQPRHHVIAYRCLNNNNNKNNMIYQTFFISSTKNTKLPRIPTVIQLPFLLTISEYTISILIYEITKVCYRKQFIFNLMHAYKTILQLSSFRISLTLSPYPNSKWQLTNIAWQKIMEFIKILLMLGM